MFISEAMAQTAQATQGLPEGSMMKFVIQFAIIFAIFYFILIRPQTKRMKEHKAQIKLLSIGDKVVCGGLYGKVVKLINDDEIEVEIANGVNVRMVKDMVGNITPKNAAVTAAKATESKTEKTPASKADKLKAAFKNKN